MTRFLSASSACTLLLALTVTGCSTVENVLSGDKVDYRSTSIRSSGLEVPPDLTQLAKDSRYQQPSGTVSASTFQATAPVAAANATPAPSTVAPQALGAVRIERLGSERWISSTLPPEQLFPLVRTFWKDSGFALVQDRADAGVLETDWVENRAKLPNDIIRNTIGKVFDSAFSTGELDKYRTRVERTPTGSDIYITHRGMVEVYTGQRTDSTVWQPRPGRSSARRRVPGAPDDQARREGGSRPGSSRRRRPAAPARARIVDGQPAATLQVDDGFDRAWRRVGVALDRTGFTVEDRDRGQGLYFVRYVDPKFAGKEEPGFFSRMLNFGRKTEDTSSLARYRVSVKAEGNTSTVSVLDAKGAPENGDAGKRIVSLLVEDLK